MRTDLEESGWTARVGGGSAAVSSPPLADTLPLDTVGNRMETDGTIIDVATRNGKTVVTAVMASGTSEYIPPRELPKDIGLVESFKLHEPAPEEFKLKERANYSFMKAFDDIGAFVRDHRAAEVIVDMSGVEANSALVKAARDFFQDMEKANVQVTVQGTDRMRDMLALGGAIRRSSAVTFSDSQQKGAAGRGA